MKKIIAILRKSLLVIGAVSTLFHAFAMFAFILFLGSKGNDPGDMLNAWKWLAESTPALLIFSLAAAGYTVFRFYIWEQSVSQ